MKPNKKKAIISIAAAMLLAVIVFLVLFTLLDWNLFLSILLAAGIYLAMTFLLKPVDRIGKVDITSLDNGEFLHEKLGEASADYVRLKKASEQITDVTLKEQSHELQAIAENILKYLIANPQKISAARRYIDYYQETAANILEHYVDLQRTSLPPEEASKTLKNTTEAVHTLKDAFQLQFEKIVQNEVMDMEADLNLLKQTLISEGYTEHHKKAGE